MKFAEAYEIAYNECNFIRRATERVKECIMLGQASPCFLFTIGTETFYFGFDGVQVVKGKHTQKRSEQLIMNGETWIVRN